MSGVVVETKGAVCTVIINRPEARNCVDRRTADQLADAFRAFDADARWSVAVLYGAGGTFCAGADLKAIASGADRNRMDRDMTKDGPMGPSRMRLSKPVIAAVSGYAVAGGWNSPCGATCVSWRRMRYSGCSAADSGCRLSTEGHRDCRV